MFETTSDSSVSHGSIDAFWQLNAFENELLEIRVLEKLWQIIKIRFQEIFVEMGIDREIFLYNLANNEISNEKWVQIQFEFLKCPNKMPLNFLRNFSENLNIFQFGYPLIKMRTFFS